MVVASIDFTSKTKYRNFWTPILEGKYGLMLEGKNDRDDWDEIREELVPMGTDIYNIIDKSGL